MDTELERRNKSIFSLVEGTTTEMWIPINCVQNVDFQYILITALQIVVAYFSFNKKFFIHCRSVYKYNTLNNKFSDEIQPVALINPGKFVFTVKYKFCCIQ